MTARHQISTHHDYTTTNPATTNEMTTRRVGKYYRVRSIACATRYRHCLFLLLLFFNFKVTYLCISIINLFTMTLPTPISPSIFIRFTFTRLFLNALDTVILVVCWFSDWFTSSIISRPQLTTHHFDLFGLQTLPCTMIGDDPFYNQIGQQAMETVWGKTPVNSRSQSSPIF